MSERLKTFIKDKNILIKQQSGFRDNRQTKDNLYFMSQKILQAFGNHEKVCCIFFDIQAAFDKVWHNGLLYKLFKLKIPYYMLIWLKFFLTNRSFKVKVGEYITNLMDITCGVPQGACLSPILFSVFINDIPINENKHNDYSLLFADDLAKMKIFNKITYEVELQLNIDLKIIQMWLSKWRLKMAPEKCSYIIFSLYYKAGVNGKKGIKKETLDLKLYGKNILPDNSPIFLGMRFDKYMSCKNQIDYIKSNGNDRLNIIKVLSHPSWKIDQKTLLKLYKSLVRSLLDYSLFIFPLLSSTNKKSIQTIQNNALRIILNKGIETDINEMYEILNIETIEERSNKLKEKYLNSADFNQNPLIIELREDYLIYKLNNHNSRIKTLLD